MRLLGRMLSRDHEVTALSSGHDAFEHLAQGQFDLILLDLMMPVMGGIELCQHIQRSRPDLLPKVVLMTGGIPRETTEQSISGVNVPILAKPFSLNDIQALLLD